MLNLGFNHNGICAVRYPRGESKNQYLNKATEPIRFGSAKKIRTGKSIAILAFGTIVNTCLEVAEDINATVIDMRFVKLHKSHINYCSINVFSNLQARIDDCSKSEDCN